MIWRLDDYIKTNISMIVNTFETVLAQEYNVVFSTLNCKI